MITSLSLLAAAATTHITTADTYTVVDVEVKKIFAGRLGKRIKTELTVERNGKRVHIYIQDVRHDRFQSAQPKWSVGDRVTLPDSVKSDKAYLRPEQIR